MNSFKSYFLTERVMTYSLPESPLNQLYDFYLVQLLKQMAWVATNDKRFSVFSRLSQDDIQNLDDINTQLISSLKPEMLDAVLFSIMSELYHFDNEIAEEELKLNTKQIQKQIQKQIKDSTGNSGFDVNDFEFYSGKPGTPFVSRKHNLTRKEIKLLSYNDELTQHTVSPSLQNIQKLDQKRYIDIEKEERKGRFLFFLSAMKYANMSDNEFVEFAKKAFMHYRTAIYHNDEVELEYEPAWEDGYGGESWQNICIAWLNLFHAKTPDNIAYYIDKIYQLQHNSDTVFNKLTKYYLIKNAGYNWLGRALNKKFETKNVEDLFTFSSPSLHRFAQKIQADYNRVTKNELIKPHQKEISIQDSENYILSNSDIEYINKNKTPLIYPSLINITSSSLYMIWAITSNIDTVLSRPFDKPASINIGKTHSNDRIFIELAFLKDGIRYTHPILRINEINLSKKINGNGKWYIGNKRAFAHMRDILSPEKEKNIIKQTLQYTLESLDIAMQTPKLNKSLKSKIKKFYDEIS